MTTALDNLRLAAAAYAEAERVFSTWTGPTGTPKHAEVVARWEWATLTLCKAARVAGQEDRPEIEKLARTLGEFAAGAVHARAPAMEDA